MMRPVIGLLLLGLAAGAAGAQAPACTYDSCALRLRNRFFGGLSLVQGHEARRVARLGLFAPRVDVLAAASDSARWHYQAFRTHQNRGGALSLVGAVAAGVAGGLAYDRTHYEKNKTAFWSLIGVGLTFSIWGEVNVTTARDHLQQSIWFYNRDLPGRAP